MMKPIAIIHYVLLVPFGKEAESESVAAFDFSDNDDEYLLLTIIIF